MPFLSQGGSVIPEISDYYPVSTTQAAGWEVVEDTTFAQEHGMEQL